MLYNNLVSDENRYSRELRLRPKKYENILIQGRQNPVMDEDKIVLDRKSFEALATDTRVKILKSLKERRKTLTEIAEEQKMSVSGIKEHLENLESAGLIAKKDDGHKWKYYELTDKGARIVGPRELRVWIALSISFIAFAASILELYYGSTIYAMPGGTLDMQTRSAMTSASVAPTAEIQPSTVAPKAEPTATSTSAAQIGGSAMKDSEETNRTAQTTNATQNVTESVAPDLTIPFIVAEISAITLLGCSAILLRNRIRK